MDITEGAIKAIQQPAIDAEKLTKAVTILDYPGDTHKRILVQSGKHEVLSVPPAPRNHHVHTLVDLVEYAKNELGNADGKGSLFEGGTKVNAVIAGGRVPADVRNSNFMGMFHVSDWFPTILTRAGITDFESKAGYELDGLDQYDALFNGAEAPRSLMLYNYYTNVQFAKRLDLWTTGGAAIRNTKYKLIHGYGSSANSQWYSTDVVFNGDDALDKPGACTQDSAWEGELEPMMFDLLSDPSETQNIYYSKLNEVVQAKVRYFHFNALVHAMRAYCLRICKCPSVRPSVPLVGCFLTFSSS